MSVPVLNIGNNTISPAATISVPAYVLKDPLLEFKVSEICTIGYFRAINGIFGNPTTNQYVFTLLKANQYGDYEDMLGVMTGNITPSTFTTRNFGAHTEILLPEEKYAICATRSQANSIDCEIDMINLLPVNIPPCPECPEPEIPETTAKNCILPFIAGLGLGGLIGYVGGKK